MNPLLKTLFRLESKLLNKTDIYMGSLYVDSLFTNIPLEETINICTESIYDQNDSTEDLNKSEFKELLPLSTKESYFIFSEILCKQIKVLAMGSPLRTTPANDFLCFYEKKKKWLEQCPDQFKPVYYRRYRDDTSVLFKSRNHLIKLRDYLKKCHPNMSFSFKEETNGKFSFLDVEVYREGNKFATTVYRKPNFRCVYTYCDNFLPTRYKFVSSTCI